MSDTEIPDAAALLACERMRLLARDLRDHVARDPSRQTANVNRATVSELVSLVLEHIEPDVAELRALLPDESMALTVALAQIRRGKQPSVNAAVMCVNALARLTDRNFDGKGVKAQGASS